MHKIDAKWAEGSKTASHQELLWNPSQTAHLAIERPECRHHPSAKPQEVAKATSRRGAAITDRFETELPQISSVFKSSGGSFAIFFNIWSPLSGYPDFGYVQSSSYLLRGKPLGCRIVCVGSFGNIAYCECSRGILGQEYMGNIASIVFVGRCENIYRTFPAITWYISSWPMVESRCLLICGLYKYISEIPKQCLHYEYLWAHFSNQLRILVFKVIGILFTIARVGPLPGINMITSRHDCSRGTLGMGPMNSR